MRSTALNLGQLQIKPAKRKQRARQKPTPAPPSHGGYLNTWTQGVALSIDRDAVTALIKATRKLMDDDRTARNKKQVDDAVALILGHALNDWTADTMQLDELGPLHAFVVMAGLDVIDWEGLARRAMEGTL